MDEKQRIELERQFRKGRGAISNAAGRYESTSKHAVDDGWGSLEEALPTLQREEIPDHSRSVIAHNNSPDVPFDRSINPYRGCEHGCVYCFARPTHSWLGYSAGIDFETRIVYKPDAAATLMRELSQASYRVEPINFGTNTDPYQPIEKKRGITRELIELLSECDHPLAITTKSTLIERDIDLLADLARRRLVHVWFSLPTLDDDLSRRLEPRTASPRRRLATMQRLSDAGIDVGVLVAPVIPLLSDGEIEDIIARSAARGARAAGYVLLRLPLEVRELFEQWLAVHEPDKAQHVMNLVRETRAGGTYQSDYGIRQRGTGAYAELIAQRFQLAKRRAGLSHFSLLETKRFKPPRPETAQLSLF